MLAGDREGVPKASLGLGRVGFGQHQQQLALEPVQLGLDPPRSALCNPI